MIAEDQDRALVLLGQGDVGLDHLVVQGDAHLERGLLRTSRRGTTLASFGIEELSRTTIASDLPLTCSGKGSPVFTKSRQRSNGAFADEHLPAQAERLDAGGDVHFVADHGVRFDRAPSPARRR